MAADPQERYRQAVEGLEAAQRAEKAALREYHDARHALITARAANDRVLAAVPGRGPCPFCGASTKVRGEERYHLDPVAGLKCGAARVREQRAALGSSAPRPRRASRPATG